MPPDFSSYFRPIIHPIPTGRAHVKPNDGATFIGFDGNGNFVNTTTFEEQTVAEAAFAANPGDVKFYCYDYEPINYRHPNHPGKIAQLEHSFIRIKKNDIYTNYAISNETGEWLVQGSTDHCVNAIDWKIADRELVGKPHDTKLHAFQKVYKDSVIRHCFMIFNIETRDAANNIVFTPAVLAMAGNGWKLQGGMSDIKPTAGTYAIKMPRKRIAIQHKTMFETEGTLSLRTGLFSAMTKKTKGFRRQDHWQPAFLMKLYQMDFFTFVSATKQQCAVILASKNTAEIAAFEKEKKIYYFTCLLQCLTALQHLHDENILHRDVKPENILLSILNGVVTSCLSDLGLSVLAYDGKYSAADYCGTPCYAAPEIKRSTTR